MHRVTSCQKWHAMPDQSRESSASVDKDKEKDTSGTASPTLLTNSHLAYTVTPKIQETVSNCLRRSTTCLEGKFKCVITSERLFQLRKTVENAAREHKIFIMKGGKNIIRNAFARRNWIEKVEIDSPPKQLKPASASYHDDVMSNLPAKQDWESPAAYVEKCEKTVMARLLSHVDAYFYWNMRKDNSDWHHRMNPNIIINRFNRSLFTSKEGLALLLQQMYWHIEPGIASVNFPRCYVLGFPDHYNNFVDDFRLTACISLLKWFVHNFQTDSQSIKSADGKIPHTVIQFAIDRCNEYVDKQKHLDIDKEFIRIWDHEWDQFLSRYYQIVHQREFIRDSKEWNVIMSNATARMVLKELMKYWPDYNIDGIKNIWIVKPGNRCRGRNIQLIKNVEEVPKFMNMKFKYVIQKYIEKPMVIYDTKFDIRQWFVVTSVQPLTIWMYRESYLRFSTQKYTLENFHESLHLTNHAIQCKYTNVSDRDKALPDENMWDSLTFQAYLKQIGHQDKWSKVIYAGMSESIIAAMLASQDTMDRRPNTFELYGADFMVAEDFTPWLIEINGCPDMAGTTSVTARMCPRMLEDLIKVIIDRRRDPKADTGRYELIYKQNLPRAPAYLGMNLSVRGRRIFKNRSRSSKLSKEKENNERKNMDMCVPIEYSENLPIECLPKVFSSPQYKGPVIADFIEELQQNVYNYSSNKGVQIIPAPPSSPVKKKIQGNKHERVSQVETRKNKLTKKSFVSRKRNVKENCRIAEEKFTSKEQVSKWEKDTTSILNSKSLILQKNNHSHLSVNKSNQNPLLSSINLNHLLPHLNASYKSRDLDGSDGLLTVGVGYSALKKPILPDNI